MTMHPYINIAIKAARTAGNIIVRNLETVDTLEITSKGLNDFVSQVDLAAEQEIIETIKKAYPQHNILSEEKGQITNSTQEGYTWIIDPLDGTFNFLRRYPQFCVSIAIMNKDVLEHGIIYEPLSQDLYVASKGEGARLNGRRIRVSNTKSYKNALVNCGFPYHTRIESGTDGYFAVSKAIYAEGADIRRSGSAALDLAYVAAGKLDGLFALNLKAWDLAAGALLVQEAGGLVSDLQGGDNFLKEGNIVAGNMKIFKALHSSLKELS